jgi:hypothetical protein
VEEKITNVDIGVLYEELSTCSNAGDIKESLKKLIQYYLEYGPSNLRLNLWIKLDAIHKEIVINAFFLYLIDVSSADKLAVLDLLQTLFIDAEPDLREKLMAIFYAALLEKNNFKLALAALSFLIHLWKNSEDGEPIREDIFPRLLDAMDVDDETVASEVIFEGLKLLNDAAPRQRERVFSVLLELSGKKRHAEIQYAVIEGLNEIITLYLSDLEAFPPEILTPRILKILTKHHQFKEPRVVYAVMRLILDHKFSLNQKAEEKLWKMFQKQQKKIPFEFMFSFWDLFGKFLLAGGFVERKKLISPFLKQIKRLSKNRADLSPEVAGKIEEIVTWLWDQNWLDPKEKDGFYR